MAKDEKEYEIVYGDNHNLSYVNIYLRLSDFLWETTACVACSEESPMVMAKNWKNKMGLNKY